MKQTVSIKIPTTPPVTLYDYEEAVALGGIFVLVGNCTHEQDYVIFAGTAVNTFYINGRNIPPQFSVVDFCLTAYKYRRVDLSITVTFSN